jgi:hypothetical protein
MIGLVIMNFFSIYADLEKMKQAKCDVLGTVQIMYSDGSIYTCAVLGQVPLRSGIKK